MEDSTIDTKKHIEKVQSFLHKVTAEIFKRTCNHDKSKLEQPEKEIFDKYTEKLKNTSYGSNEYKQYLIEMKPALDHHYANNSHHPNHFKNGISGMNLIDLIEMLCDWKASTLRHNDGNIESSIEIGQERFGYSNELKQILLNTLDVL